MSASGACRITLPPDETAPGRARAFLRSVRYPGQDGAVLEDAVLLVSELVTNAIRHAAPPITLEVVCQAPDGLSIRVTDGSPLPPSGRALTAHEESGRGIALVDVLSADWGVEPAEPGKAVWFRLGAPAADREHRDGPHERAPNGSSADERTRPAREPTLAGFHGTRSG